MRTGSDGKVLAACPDGAGARQQSVATLPTPRGSGLHAPMKEMEIVTISVSVIHSLAPRIL